MDLLSPLVDQTSAVEPIQIPALGDIRVLPYIRGRLVFANLTTRALKDRQLKHVLVDLPAFMNDYGWLKVPLGLFPSISIAAFQRNDGETRGILFCPNDAACIAAYTALTKPIPLHCLDDSDMLNYPKEAIFHPPIPAGDDYRVFQVGVEDYFRPLWARMEEAWEHATAEQRFFTAYRAQKVISALTECAYSGKPTLLVIEYQLLWAIQETLREGVGDHVRFLFKWKDAPAVLIPEDPYFAWIHGVLDDFPAVNMAFWQKLAQGAGQPFDKMRELENLLEKIILNLNGNEPSCREHRRRASTRNLITFQAYLRKMTVSCRRYIPEPAAHLFHAAETCAGRDFLKALAEELLRYPDSLNSAQMNFILSNTGGIVAGGPGLDVPDLCQLPSFFTGEPILPLALQGETECGGPEDEARRRIVDLIHHKTSREEDKHFSGDLRREVVRWEIKADYRLHSQACAHARVWGQRQRALFVPRRSWGRMEGGVDWKATLSARAKGEKHVYVKHRSCERVSGGNGDEFTPVVFLFASAEEIDVSLSYEVHDGNLSLRNIELGNDDFDFSIHPEPDKVFSVYVTSKKRTFVLDPHIQQESLTSLSLIYTKPVMGLERYQAITTRGKDLQCRVEPDVDPDLIRFPLSERGIAWATKYARDRVFVVAKEGWEIPPRVSRFAKKRGITIRIVPLSMYRHDFLERLKICYFLSTQLKKHPQREQIVRRFV